MPTTRINPTTAEIEAVIPKDTRTLLGFANTHASDMVYVSDEQGQCAAGSGFPVFPDSALIFEDNDGSELKKRWFIISDNVAGTDVRIIEQFKKPPVDDIQDNPPKKDPKA